MKKTPLLAKNLRHLMDAMRLSQNALARMTGISQTTIGRILSGEHKAPETKTLLTIAEFFKISVDAFINEDLTGQPSTVATQGEGLCDAAKLSIYHPDDVLDDGEIEIPALNVRVGAGNRILLEPVQEERKFRYSREWILRYGLVSDKLFMFRVFGTSMEPVIQNGSWITVELGDHPVKDGQPYLIRSGDQVMVKYLWRRPDGGLIIRSHNPNNPDIVVPFSEMEHVAVLGEVVESTNMWRKPVKPHI